MKKVAVITDSNSGITQSEAKKLGIHVVPMPFFVNGDTFYEDISMSQDEFYGYLAQGGWLCFEIGYDQGAALKEMMTEAGYGQVQIIKDLAGLDRVAVGQKK